MCVYVYIFLFSVILPGATQYQQWKLFFQDFLRQNKMIFLKTRTISF